MDRVVTVILQRNGKHHLTLTDCSREDAERWAEEGFHVFLLCCRTATLWAMNHVNSGKVFTSDEGSVTPHNDFLLLPFKE